MRTKLQQLWHFLDEHLLTILTASLIVVVPLYPKLPLADLLEGYIVRLRLEDLLIGLTLAFYFVQLWRRRIVFPQTVVAKLMLGYLVIGLLSSLSAIFITQTVPLESAHLFKLALHYVRRVEYFSLFFVAYASLRTRRDLQIFLITALVTLAATLLYGIGQKYWYWPAFSTMNREFSKGMRLYLSPTSRLMSTFGGHYDYGAYLMIALTGLVPALWLARRRWQQLLFGVLAVVAYWSLLLTASRTSFGGYVLGVTAIAILLAKREGLMFALKRYFAVMSLSLVMLLTVGDLSERFFQLVQSPAAIHTFIPWVETGKIEEYLYKTKDVFLRLGELRRRLTEPSSPPPPQSISTDELSKVAVSSDIPPSPTKPLPPDVTAAEDQIRRTQEASSSATASATRSGGQYSENALKYGLSAAIRLDVLWPRAIEGFTRNPLLGSGYSTLVKGEYTEFTQAESTDNDYLRMLGETGLLGTLLFLSIPFYLCYLAVKKYRETDSLVTRILLLTLLGATVAMLVNATYIDVFESSKVAYTFWLLAAVVIRVTELGTARAKGRND